MPSPPAPTPSPPPRFVILSPTYNHGRALPAVLDALTPLALPIIVVNDGSTDDTDRTLAAWQASDPSIRSLSTHQINRGKAAALLTGFTKARELGYTHALTIDSDGQHSSSDLLRIFTESTRYPRALIVGARPRTIPGCPIKCLVGRYISNHFVWLASGVRTRDSQSGLRAYPLDLINGLLATAGRYAFETEILTRAGWAGLPVIEVPISGLYHTTAGRVTHFRVGRDTWEAIQMHARLIARSLLPGDPVPRIAPHAHAPSAHGASPPDESNLANSIVQDPMIGTILHRLWWWLGPRRLRMMATGDHRERERLAASVATGFFMATVPLYGIKTVACLWLSARFRMHPGVVIAVSSLCTPPLGFVFVFFSLIAGHLLLQGALPTLESLPTWSNFNFAAVRIFLWEWIAGSIIVGTILALISYTFVRLLLRTAPARTTPKSD